LRFSGEGRRVERAVAVAEARNSTTAERRARAESDLRSPFDTQFSVLRRIDGDGYNFFKLKPAGFHGARRDRAGSRNGLSSLDDQTKRAVSGCSVNWLNL